MRRARRPPPYVRKNGWLRRLSVMGKRELSRCRHGGTHPGTRNTPRGRRPLPPSPAGRTSRTAAAPGSGSPSTSASSRRRTGAGTARAVQGIHPGDDVSIYRGCRSICRPRWITVIASAFIRRLNSGPEMAAEARRVPGEEVEFGGYAGLDEGLGVSDGFVAQRVELADADVGGREAGQVMGAGRCGVGETSGQPRRPLPPSPGRDLRVPSVPVEASRRCLPAAAGRSRVRWAWSAPMQRPVTTARPASTAARTVWPVWVQGWTTAPTRLRRSPRRRRSPPRRVGSSRGPAR